MTNVIGNISESLLENEWDLDFYLKMAKKALESADYNKAINIIKKGNNIAIKFKNTNYIKEFKNLIRELDKKETNLDICTDEKIDLLKIKGIGKSLAIKLGEAGFGSIEQLANTTPERLSIVRGISVNNAKNFIKLSNDYVIQNTKPEIFNTIQIKEEFSLIEDKNSSENQVSNSIERRKFKLEKEFTRKGYNLIRSIYDILGYDLLAIKILEINKKESIIFLVPIKINDFNHPIVISEKGISIPNPEKNQDRLEYIQNELETLQKTQRNIYMNLCDNGSLYNFLNKCFKYNFKIEFRNNTDLFFRSESIEYKIFISPIFICQQKPGFIEKIVPYPYQRSSNIHFIPYENLSKFLDFIEKKYYLIRKYENNKITNISEGDFKTELISKLQQFSIPFLALGILMYLIYPFFIDYIKIIIGISSGIVLSYSILLTYYYINYKKRIQNQSISGKDILHKKDVKLDEIDLELIGQELNKEDMTQFIYECFGKDHTLEKLIYKDKKLSNIAPKKENRTNRSQKEDIIKKYTDFLED
ncbi:MAG: helix-hairpin-helix domain-containing protein [Candidatus Lokiarchaeota archaeon]|nr:helix-hairpin-helix domain-containing protein [Candidatus Lokiarchaeota archaeon]